MYRWGDYLRLNETIALCGTGCVVFDIQAPSHRCNSIYPYFRSEISDAYEAVVENLSQDIQKEFPGIQGFSARNMWDMARFYSEYQSNEILQPLVAEISWSKHIVILTKCKETQQRQFYILATKKYGWTKDVLIHKIELKTYENFPLGQSNFDTTLTESSTQSSSEEGHRKRT